MDFNSDEFSKKHQFLVTSFLLPVAAYSYSEKNFGFDKLEQIMSVI